MTEVTVPVLLPYLERFVREGRRRTESEWFLENGAIRIRQIESGSAPIAYRIHPELPEFGLHDRSYVIRHFEERLWWPLLSREGPVSVSRFKDFASKGSPAVLLAIDPGIPVSTLKWPVKPFDSAVARKVEDAAPARPDRWACAHRNTQRVLFCDDTVLLEAGDPIVYARPLAVQSYEIVVGHSAMDRREHQFRLPGPDWKDRIGLAKRGLAFGITECGLEITRLVGLANSARFASQIDVRPGDHSAQAAPILCAKLLVESVLARAFRDHYGSILERTLPGLSDQFIEAKEWPEGSSYLYFRMIEQIVESDDVEFSAASDREKMFAREILRRLRNAGVSPLARQDEEALTLLAQARSIDGFRRIPGSVSCE
jgi:hypothetical protein